MRVASVTRVFTGGVVGPPRAITAGGALAVGALALALCIVALSFAHLGFTRVCVLLLLAPLVEEAVFRAGLQEALLLRWNAPRLANLGTALVFGLAHVVARGDPAAFAVVIPALLIGAAYGRWRRLRWCIALHSAMNGAWLAAVLAGPASVVGF